jgi:hypothetical protein
MYVLSWSPDPKYNSKNTNSEFSTSQIIFDEKNNTQKRQVELLIGQKALELVV